MDLLTQLRYFAPELTLSGVILVVMVGDRFRRRSHRDLVITVALVGLLGTMAATYLVSDGESHAIFSGMAVLDPFAIFFKYLAVAATAIVLVFTMRSRDAEHG